MFNDTEWFIAFAIAGFAICMIGDRFLRPSKERKSEYYSIFNFFMVAFGTLWTFLLVVNVVFQTMYSVYGMAIFILLFAALTVVAIALDKIGPRHHL